MSPTEELRPDDNAAKSLMRIRREVQDLIQTPGLAVSVRAALWLVADSLEVAWVACSLARTVTTFGRRIADARAVLWGEATYDKGVATLAPASHQAMVLSVLEDFGAQYDDNLSLDEKDRIATQAADQIEYLVGLPTPARKKPKRAKPPPLDLKKDLVRNVVRELRARSGKEPSRRAGEKKSIHDPVLELFDLLGVRLGAGDEKSLYTMMSRLKANRPMVDFGRDDVRVAFVIDECGEVTFERPSDLHPDEVESSGTPG